MKDIDYRVYEALGRFNNFKERSTEVCCSINTGRHLYLHNSRIYWIDLNNDVFFSLCGYNTNVIRNRLNAALKLNDCKVFQKKGELYIVLYNGNTVKINDKDIYSLSELIDNN